MVSKIRVLVHHSVKPRVPSFGFIHTRHIAKSRAMRAILEVSALCLLSCMVMLHVVSLHMHGYPMDFTHIL